MGTAETETEFHLRYFHHSLFIRYLFVVLEPLVTALSGHGAGARGCRARRGAHACIAHACMHCILIGWDWDAH